LGRCIICVPVAQLPLSLLTDHSQKRLMTLPLMLVFHFPNPILSPQVTSLEAIRILASQENASDSELLRVANTMDSVGTEVLATNPATEPLPNLPLSNVVSKVVLQQ